jgi:hypothetical protein
MLFMSAPLDLTRRALIAVDAVPSAVSKDPVVRRYRLARVSLSTRPDPALDRFAHLRRSYD